MYNNALNLSSNDALYNYIVAIEELARTGAKELYDVNRFSGFDNVKIRNWCDTAIRCATLDPIAAPEEYSEEHDTLVRNMYTQYGYAVEEYVNIGVIGGDLPIPAGYTITAQETHGNTRPDFVIRQDNPPPGSRDNTVAWLDITSSGSSGHINKKCGSGWQNVPFVAELFYPPLTLSTISTTGDYSIAQRARLNSAIRRQEMRQRLLTEHMSECTNNALGTLYEILRSNQIPSLSEIANEFSKSFKLSFDGFYNYQQIVKSILSEYMYAPRNYYHSTARFILYHFYQQIRSCKPAAMRYISESYRANSSPYLTGAELDAYLDELLGE